MDSEYCKFCERGDKLKEKFIPFKEMRVSYLCLFRSQYYPGRCTLILKNHYKMLPDIPFDEARLLLQDVYQVTTALKELYNPDSFDIAMFGVTTHMHVHIVPRFKGTRNWGQPYVREPVEIVTVDDSELERIMDTIRKKVEQTGSPE